MRKVAFVIPLALSLVALAGSAFADGPTASGIEVGLRTGYSLPLGNVRGDSTTTQGGTTVTESSEALSDVVKGRVPIWIDAGYRINGNLYVGAFFQYGIMFVNTDKSPGCNQSGVSCSAHDIQFGLNAHYHLMPESQFDPWGGVGIGYESVSSSVSGNGQSGDGGDSGFQFVNLQLGADYKVMPNFGVGPFLSFSVGQYTSESGSFNGMTISQDIQSKALHEWLTIGLRGAYDINL
jgi:opacity protein-like surface antigen